MAGSNGQGNSKINRKEFAHISHPKKRLALRAFAKFGTVTAAMDAAGMSRRSHYVWMREDAEYAEAFEDAKERAIDALEQEMFRRALDSSDTLLIFAMKGLRPDKYSNRVTVHGNLTHDHEVRVLTDEDRRRVTEIAQRRLPALNGEAE